LIAKDRVRASKMALCEAKFGAPRRSLLSGWKTAPIFVYKSYYLKGFLPNKDRSMILPVIVLTLIVATFGTLLVYAASLVGPAKNKTKAKYMPYECGLPGQETAKSNISIRFYLTAILFIMFDIEILFLYPWAVTYREFVNAGHGAYMFWVLLVFLGLFVFGLIWEIKSKALEWE